MISGKAGEHAASLAALKRGAALALVLSVAGLEAAAAQQVIATGPAEAAPADEAPASPEDAKRERIYVLGQRITSAAALPDDPIQVVNVIDGETLAEQGVSTLEQALRNVPGITTQIGEGGVLSGDQFFIRGISAKNDIYADGLRDFGVFTRDSFNYGQVEVFKGPSSAAFGRGAAGGGINTSSKTPAAETFGSATLSAGDGEYMRAVGDWNQDLGDGMAVRVAAMVHSSENTGRDVVYSDRWGIAPTVGFGLGGDTTFTIGYFHQTEEKTPDYGLPTVTVNNVIRPITDFGLDPSTYAGFVTDIDETVVDTFTARLSHRVNDWLTLTNDTKYGVYQRYSQFTPTSCNATCIGNLIDGNDATVPTGTPGGPGPWDQDTNGVQNIATAQISAPIAGLRSELLVGVDASWQTNDRNQYSYTAPGSRPTAIPLLDPQNVARPVVNMARSNIRDTTAYDVSVFASERLWVTDHVSLVAGLRAAWYEVDQDTTTFAATGTTFAGVSSKSDYVTPQIGVIYEPSSSQTWWISYSEAAKPPGVSVNNGDTLSAPGAGQSITASSLDPEETTNIEAGARVGLLENRVQLQGAVFQTKKGNVKETDPVSGSIVRSGDGQEITGVELGVGGAITDNWSINASVTWLDTEYTDLAPVAAGATCTPVAPATTCPNPGLGKQITFTPETAASLWTTYNFTGVLAGLEIGGGVNYQDDVWLNTANTSAAPGYTTFDGLVSYAFDRYRISLNAYNLGDELYFAQVHGNRLTPGQGRTFIASLGLVY